MVRRFHTLCRYRYLKKQRPRCPKQFWDLKQMTNVLDFIESIKITIRRLDHLDVHVCVALLCVGSEHVEQSFGFALGHAAARCSSINALQLFLSMRIWNGDFSREEHILNYVTFNTSTGKGELGSYSNQKGRQVRIAPLTNNAKPKSAALHNTPSANDVQLRRRLVNDLQSMCTYGVEKRQALAQAKQRINAAVSFSIYGQYAEKEKKFTFHNDLCDSFIKQYHVR